MHKPRLAWDSTTIIDALQQDQNWWPEIRPIYADAINGNVLILVSEISVAETCKLSGPPTSGLSVPETVKKIERFFSNLFILAKAVTREESRLASEFIRDHHLETCDAIIAATAVVHGATTLYTRDGTKKEKKEQAEPIEMQRPVAWLSDRMPQCIDLFIAKTHSPSRMTTTAIHAPSPTHLLTQL